MEWITAQQAASQWNTSVRTVQNRCREGRITGAERWGRTWMIPANAEKPADRRASAAKQTSDAAPQLRLPRQAPLIFMTDLHGEIGEPSPCADPASNDAARTLMAAWLAYHQGHIERAVGLAKSLLSLRADFCGTLSIGSLIAACSLWQGDLHLWMQSRSQILKAQCSNESEHALQQLCLAITDEGLLDNAQLPEWFQAGQFGELPTDSQPTAWFYYAKYLYISARDLAVGKTSCKDVEGLGLMRTLPYLIEPMIAQAKTTKILYAEIFLRGLCAKVYHDLGDMENATRQLDTALRLGLPDQPYGLFAELRVLLSGFFDECINRVDPQAGKQIRELHKQMLSGFSKMQQALRNVKIVTTLSAREQEVAQLAALGLSNLEIAGRLHISVSSVKSIISMIMNKTGTQKRSEFARHIL